MEDAYRQTQEFHRIFAPSKVNKPTAFTEKEALARVRLITEELVELLYAASDNKKVIFEQLIQEMHISIQQAKQKVNNKNKPTENVLVEETDALLDSLYLLYGSFVMLGVDPTPLFQIVHKANMGKLFPDGKPHYDKLTGKVLKPDYWQKEYAPEAELSKALEKQSNSLN